MEFSGQTYNFVDKEPVEMDQLILATKKHLGLKYPKKIYIPYNSAKTGKKILSVLLRGIAKIGVVARMPQELMFLESFYLNQTLSTTKLQRSSFQDPMPKETIYTRLPDMASYYLTRWHQQNLIMIPSQDTVEIDELDQGFRHHPEALLEQMHATEKSGDSQTAV